MFIQPDGRVFPRQEFQAINLKADSTEISSSEKYFAKKARLLSFNDDTIRQLYTPKPSYRFI